MSHLAQQNFCNQKRQQYPSLFKGRNILDVGSMDINGNNRQFFEDIQSYVGLDLGPGNNVDVQCSIHEYNPEKSFDVVISTECFEHDKNWKEGIRRMYELLCPGGMMILTIAGKHRPEHGTTATSPADSPYTTDYYRNITVKDLTELFDLEEEFLICDVSYDHIARDTRFFGIKKNGGVILDFNPDGFR